MNLRWLKTIVGTWRGSKTTYTLQYLPLGGQWTDVETVVDDQRPKSEKQRLYEHLANNPASRVASDGGNFSVEKHNSDGGKAADKNDE